MMKYDLWKLSILNIITTPMRSLLTVLGMGIGIGAILAVLTLGDAGKVQVENEMMRLGIDRVWLTADGDSRLTHGDAELLSQALDTTVTEQVYYPLEFKFASASAQGVLVGCGKSYLQVMDTEVILGRALWPLEWESGSRTVLVGHELAKELGIRNNNALKGQKLSVGGMLFTVAGVIRQNNELSQVDSSRAVFLPVGVFCELMGSTVHELTISVPKDTKPQAVAAMAVDTLKRKSGKTAQAVTMQVQIEAANSVMDIFIDVLKWVAAICIVVGGIGVMNILLVSVRERRREIGIMKSLGATSGQVRRLFLLEALIYALIGGVLGVLAGIGIISIAAKAIGLQARAQGGDMATVVAVAIGIGLFFGVVPASRAAGMTPVDALRE